MDHGSHLFVNVPTSTIGPNLKCYLKAKPGLKIRLEKARKFGEI